MKVNKKVGVFLIIAGILLICLIAHIVPVTYLKVNSVDMAHDFSNNELLLDESSINGLIDAFDGCLLWQTFYNNFPVVSGTDIEILMTGRMEGKVIRVQAICYTDRHIYLRIGDDRAIYTIYQSEKNDLIYSILLSLTK